MKYFVAIILLLQSLQITAQDRIKGVTLVAPPDRFQADPILDITEIHANWISIVPYGYFRKDDVFIKYNLDWQWWGEREEGVLETIKHAKNNGVKIMLKPQVWSHDKWIGDHAYSDNKDWEAWEKSYTDFILYYAAIAQSQEVDLLCIGTELKEHIKKRPAYYFDLISKIREVYCGELTYSSNWDSYQDIPFWNEVDYIGLSAYFPLTDESTPKIKTLVKAWKDVKMDLKQTSEKYNKKIIFTEYGYLTVDGCAGKTWELEQKINSLQVNQEAQANAFQALFQVMSDEEWWHGGFIWKWFPFGKGGEGYNEKDYTPQGKSSSDVIAQWYNKIK